VVNVTLNLLEGAPSGWAERKAAPFTITPLRAGAACLGEKDEHGDPEGRYVRTTDYGGQEHESGRGDEKSGITLGTAMTISGAAVSPSMGYHSSPATSFLMTLFDVRLGAWLPNPGVTQRWTPAKPSNALRPLFNEMLGRANDKRSDVYLSDGGHFDNLGVYEMLRRRCRIIVAIDTGSDPEYKYSGSGNALRLAAIDFSINVRFVAPIKSKRDSMPLAPCQIIIRMRLRVICCTSSRGCRKRCRRTCWRTSRRMRTSPTRQRQTSSSARVSSKATAHWAN
jgi:hypothetical protein